MPKGEFKPCLQCGEKIVRGRVGEQQWELQKTHRECRGIYDKEQTKEYHFAQAHKRYFKKDGKKLTTRSRHAVMTY